MSLVLLGRFALSAHMLLVPHEICEHGQLVHLHHPHHHARVEPSTVDRPPAVRGAAEEPSGHEHCDALGIHEVPPTLAAAVIQTDQAAWRIPLPTAPAAIERPAVPLLLLAPKQSPPRS